MTPESRRREPNGGRRKSEDGRWKSEGRRRMVSGYSNVTISGLVGR